MISEDKKKVIELYNQGKKQYKLRDFKAASKYFKQALELDPSDGPSQVFLDRSEYYLKDPPPDDWDGVFVMKTK